MFLRRQFLYARIAKTHSLRDLIEQPHARKGLADAVLVLYLGHYFCFLGADG